MDIFDYHKKNAANRHHPGILDVTINADGVPRVLLQPIAVSADAPYMDINPDDYRIDNPDTYGLGWASLTVR